jgi:DNA-binding transcriptional LysR family regulator
VRTVVLAPPGHRLRSRARVKSVELAGEPLLAAPVAFRSRASLERACAAAGVTPAIAHESPSPAALAALAEAGVGVAVLSDDAVPRRDDGRAWPLLVHDGEPLVDDVRLYARPTAPRTAATDAFLAEARLAAAREGYVSAL